MTMTMTETFFGCAQSHAVCRAFGWKRQYFDNFRIICENLGTHFFTTSLLCNTLSTKIRTQFSIFSFFQNLELALKLNGLMANSHSFFCLVVLKTFADNCLQIGMSTRTSKMKWHDSDSLEEKWRWGIFGFVFHAWFGKFFLQGIKYWYLIFLKLGTATAILV